jgi:hypothetical protein
MSSMAIEWTTPPTGSPGAGRRVPAPGRRAWKGGRAGNARLGSERAGRSRRLEVHASALLDALHRNPPPRSTVHRLSPQRPNEPWEPGRGRPSSPPQGQLLLAVLVELGERDRGSSGEIQWTRDEGVTER